MIRPILIYGDPKLRVKSTDVDHFDEELFNLVQDLRDTLANSKNGIGLAAPQIGVNKRVVLFIHPETKEEIVLVNPEIFTDGTEVRSLESCLSIPKVSAEVLRYKSITIQYQSIDGNCRSLTLTGFPAIVAQHECDHLEGKLYIDYLSKLKRDILLRKIDKYENIRGPSV